MSESATQGGHKNYIRPTASLVEALLLQFNAETALY